LDVSEHVTDLLPLEAAGILDAEEAARVAAHLRECAHCTARAAEWRDLAEGVRAMPQARPSPALQAWTRQSVEWGLAQRADRNRKRAALCGLVVFSWLLALMAWPMLDPFGRGLTACLGRPLGSTALWFAMYLVTGWVTAGAAAALLGRRAREEGGNAWSV
jgi:hypothetical protein